MRQAEVQSLFLQRFGQIYPQFRFRGIRRFPDRSYSPYAFALRIAAGKAGREVDLLCIVLTDGHPEEVRHFIRLVHEAQPLPENPIETLPTLVAPFFSEEAQALCREAALGYFDLAGNAGIETQNLWAAFSGKPNVLVRKRQVSSPYAGKGERVVRRLLLEPGRAWTMRSLAQAAQVSLGLCSMVTTALAESGAVTKDQRGLQTVDMPVLLEAWAEVYDLRASPLRTYRAWDDSSRLERMLAGLKGELAEQYALTLWSGAHRLLNDGQLAQHVALYWAGEPEALAEALGLTPGMGRTLVFVFEPYDESLLWGRTRTAQGQMIVHPLQLYLDLGSGDDQELRLAQRVRERLVGF